MAAERLEQFANDRLGITTMPEDLRIMLAAQWSGDSTFADIIPIEFLDDELHPLLDTSYMTAAELATPDIKAYNAALAKFTQYAKIVARLDDLWVGYWMHPDDVADQGPSIIELDTEFSIQVVPGRTLAEACAAMVAEYADPDPETAYAQIAARLSEAGIVGIARNLNDVPEPTVTVDPQQLLRDYDAQERKALGLPELG